MFGTGDVGPWEVCCTVGAVEDPWVDGGGGGPEGPGAPDGPGAWAGGAPVIDKRPEIGLETSMKYEYI